MLFSMVSVVNAAPSELYRRDYGVSRTAGKEIAVGPYTNADANADYYSWIPSALTCEIGLDSQGDKYLSMTGKFSGVGSTMIRQSTAFTPQYSEGNYEMNQFKVKISESWTGIRFQHVYGSSLPGDRIAVTIPEELRGTDVDTPWVDVKIVYNDTGYITYVNDVPGTFKTSENSINRLQAASGQYYEFSNNNGGNVEGTALLKEVIFYDVPASDVFKFDISGSDTARIPNSNEETAAEEQYTAEAFDYMNNALTDITWSLSEDYEGVSIDNTGKLTVEKTAKSGVIGINAEVNGELRTKNVSLTKEEISSISVLGDTDIPLKNNYEVGTITRQYTAEALDFANEPVLADVEWSVENAPQGVSIDNTGLVTLADDVTEGSFDVAASASGKTGRLNVTISPAALAFQNETDLFNVHMNNVEPGEKAPNGAIMPNVYGQDSSTNIGSEGYTTPFEFVEESEGDVALKMTFPALTEQGSYKTHAAYFNQTTGAIDSDIFVVSLKFKYNADGTDALRLELFNTANEKITYHMSNSVQANLYYKHDIGKWQEVKFVFNRNTLSCGIYLNNYLHKTETVSEDFWTGGIKQLRAIHCTNSGTGVPVDNKVHELYLDDYRAYISQGPALEGVHATGTGSDSDKNILNLVTGFSNWNIGSSPSLSGEEIELHLTFANSSENDVAVCAVAGVYENGALKAVSTKGDFVIGGNDVSENNILKLTIPQTDDFTNYTIKVMSWYEDGTPFDYTFNMTNDRWNFNN